MSPPSSAPPPPLHFAETLFDAAGATRPLRSTLRHHLRARQAPPRGAPPASLHLCILGSSSRGNAAALRIGTGPRARLVLLDAGFSPAKTRRLLGLAGLDLERIEAVALTHTHRDHLHEGWARALPSRARFYIHERHRNHARRAGILFRKTEIFRDGEPFDIAGLMGTATLVAHDDMGSAALRFTLPAEANAATPADPEHGGCAPRGGASVAYATDIGEAPAHLIDLYRGVHTLAIESNYCPKLQHASGRHPVLVTRVTAGSGHISNEQCARAAAEIGPRRTVLLHLSRECNTPELALSHHAGRAYETFAAPQVGPSEWFTATEPAAETLFAW